MRQGSTAAAATALLIWWSAIPEVRADGAANGEPRPEGPTVGEERVEQERGVIYSREFIRAPEAIFAYRCRHEYWKAVLVNLGPFYPEFCRSAAKDRARPLYP